MMNLNSFLRLDFVTLMVEVLILLFFRCDLLTYKQAKAAVDV